jgi:hypothetical protein
MISILTVPAIPVQLGIRIISGLGTCQQGWYILFSKDSLKPVTDR